MQLKTILNRVQKHPSFVYEAVRVVEHPRLAIEVEITSPRQRPRAVLAVPTCGAPRTRCYDRPLSEAARPMIGHR